MPMPTNGTNGTYGTAGGEYLFAAKGFVKDHLPHRHRRRRRQVLHGHRRAARKADTAVLLVTAHGMPVNEAAERCDISPVYVYAMKTVRESGNTALYDAMLRGDAPILESAKLVENAAKVITAFSKCSGLERELVRLATGATTDAVTLLLNMSPDQLVATSNALGLDWVWDSMISAAMPASESENVA